jgi:peptidoglycan/LPS O-acetylase OafA/YrhL
MKYRPEIDGLRAISVISVFLFHLSDKSASGGFVGVDVFFVISGYLITAIISADQDSGHFSLIAFYVRRIKRIAPALLVLISVVVCVGYLILPPGDYLSLARSGLFALGGASNFYFFSNTGYFDAAAASMPLLHTWSLGVEEQFYLAWPTLLIVLRAQSNGERGALLRNVLVLAVVSFAVYVLTRQVDPKLAFYMFYTRGWEFALGGAIGYLPATADSRFYRLKTVLPWFGLFLIVASVWQFRSAIDFTGDKTVASVIGACLIICAIQPKSFCCRMLASQPFVFFGKISYSLYLVHLPIIVFWKYYTGTQGITPASYPILIFAAVAASWLSWRYVEQPCRRARWSWRLVFSTFLISDLAVASLCAGVIVTNGAATRIPSYDLAMGSLEAMWEWQCPSFRTIAGVDRCTGGAPWDTAVGHVVIWGDSNAAHFMPLFDVAARAQDVSITLIDGCAPIIGIGFANITIPGRPAYTRQCDEMRQPIIDAIVNNNINLVILSAAWAADTPLLFRAAGDPIGESPGLIVMKDAFDRLLPKITKDGKKIVVITQIPNWATDPIPCVIAKQTSLLREASFRAGCHIDQLDKIYYDTYQRKTDELIRSFDGKNGVVVWPSAQNLCSEHSCISMVDGEFIYRDSGHLRRNLKEQTDIDLAELLHFPALVALANKADLPRRGAEPAR